VDPLTTAQCAATVPVVGDLFRDVSNRQVRIDAASSVRYLQLNDDQNVAYGFSTSSRLVTVAMFHHMGGT